MTTTNNLEALLRRWAVLEPERCREKGGGYSVCCGGIWRTALDDFSAEPHRIKGALREACWNRGMYDMVDDLHKSASAYLAALESEGKP